jgi:hypothetical protein
VFARSATAPMASRAPLPVAAIVLALAAVLALVLALPGQTVTTRYLDDLFVALDAAHRVLAGEVPSRDFHTPLGPLASYIPAAGAWLTGGLGGAMPVGMALTIAVLAPAIAHVVSSRLHSFIALPFAAFVLIVLAVPLNLGEGVTLVSHARFYNRIGWACIATLVVMVLPKHPDDDRPAWLDAATAALLTLAMIYTKITYGVVAVAFLAFMLLDRSQRRWAAAALGAVLVAAVAVELVWRSSAAYASDIALALHASGIVRGSPGQIFDHVLGNFADYVLLALLGGLALRATRSLRDALFYVFCAVGGFLIINQDMQTWGILTIHAAAAVAAEKLVRHYEEVPQPTERDATLAAGAQLVVLALVLPTIVHCLIPLTLHAAAATLRAGEEVRFRNMRGVRIVDLWTPGEYEAATGYLAAVREGAEALAPVDPPAARVFVLGFANPFSAALGLAPARGDASFLQWGRTLDDRSFVAPDRLLADVEIVMEPKPVGAATPAATGLATLYGPFVAAAYDVVGETEHWRIRRRRGAGGPR